MYIFTPYFKQIGILHDLQTIERLKVDGQDTIESRNEEQLLGKSVKKMTRIVTISNFTKKELLRYYNRDAEVVYNCVPNYLMGRPLGEKEIPSIVDKPYILDINSFKEYKNVDRLIHAFSAIKDKIPHLLYLKGAPDDEKYIDHLKDVISHEGITDRVIIDYVARDGDEIEYLYSHASLIISPSFMEGFGFAPIEGILHERPVLISNIETLVETTCGLVPSFDPNSIPQMAELMMSEINQPTPKSELSRRANVIKEKYTRKKQIKKLAEVIKDTCYGTES